MKRRYSLRPIPRDEKNERINAEPPEPKAIDKLLKVGVVMSWLTICQVINLVPRTSTLR